MIKPISKNKLFENIANEIINLVKEGTWQAGDKIPGELELAESFNVSRNILREALKSLELSGILEAKAGKGTFLTVDVITNIKKMEFFNTLKDNNELNELMETRLVIEPPLGKLAAENATDEEIESIKKYIVKDNEYTIDKGAAFHMSIVKLSQNKILYKLLNSIIDEIEAQRFMYIDKYINSDFLAESNQEHRNIYEALKNRDGDLVQELLYNHIKREIQ